LAGEVGATDPDLEFLRGMLRELGRRIEAEGDSSVAATLANTSLKYMQLVRDLQSADKVDQTRDLISELRVVN